MKPIYVTAFLLLLAPLTARADESEPNDSLASATPLAATRTGAPDFLDGRGPAGAVAHGRLDPGDVDFFSFAARAGDLITASVVEPARGEFHDAVLAVFGPGDTEAVAQDDDGGPGFLPRLAVRADRTGTWTLAVAGFGDTELEGDDHEQRFDYRLVAAVTSDPGLAESDLRGGNDAPSRPDLALLGRAGRGTRGAVIVTGDLARGDVDHFAVPVARGAVLTASLFDEASGERNDSQLRILDRRGRLLDENDDGGPGFLSNVVTDGEPLSPFVIVAVDGFDPDPGDAKPHEETFRYRLVVSWERQTGYADRGRRSRSGR